MEHFNLNADIVWLFSIIFKLLLEINGPLVVKTAQEED